MKKLISVAVGAVMLSGAGGSDHSPRHHLRIGHPASLSARRVIRADRAASQPRPTAPAAARAVTLSEFC